MSIQFDWHFADEESGKRIEETRVHLRRRSRQVGPTTASQHRLHAALARTKPRLYPEARPELVVHSSDMRRQAVDTARPSWIARLLTRIRACLEHRPSQAGLTASQRRLHAALARTKPWLCPDAQLELVAHGFDRRKSP